MRDSTPPDTSPPILNHHHYSTRRSFHSLIDTSLVNPILKNAPSPLHQPLDHHDLAHAAPDRSFSKNRLSLPSDLSQRPRLRQLILPMIRTAPTSDRSSSPGSPPDLTDSKSSKSSSYQSSSLVDSAPADLSHFEDISLDDVASVSNPWTEKPIKGGHQIRSHPPLYRSGNAPSRSMRDLTNLAKSGPQSHTIGARNRFQLPIPSPRSTRPRVKQLITPEGSLPLEKRPSGSLSASPTTAQRPFSPYPRSTGASSSSGRSRFSSASMHVRRRQSWQPGRKTVKELEDEYHDSDEDIPDDAVIWNVPVSPRPPHEREFRRAATEPASLSSSLTQPESPNNSSADSQVLDRADTNTSSASAMCNKEEEIKRPATPNSPISETSSGDFPRVRSRREAALSDLCDEVRDLTEALEVYAEQSERHQEEQIQSGQTKASSVPSRFSPELPPIRRNDPLLDPLPVSKEKERFLTRTRPSWLPPKSQKEERKHLREYQKIMAQAAEAEKRRQRRQYKIQCERDAAALEGTKAWDTKIIPNWKAAVREPKTRELWLKGVPPQRRGDVWSRAIGNDLGLTHASFEATLERAKESEERHSNMEPEERERDTLAGVFDKINSSATKIYPELNIFSPTGPLHQSLLDVCKAYAVYRIEVSQTTILGVQSLTALLLLNLPPASAFIALANILHRPLPSALLANDSTTLQTTYNVILSTLQQKLPTLHGHLLSLSHRSSASSTQTQESDISLPPSLLITELLHPLLAALVFASPRVGLDFASRIWDVAVFEGDSAIVHAAVTMLERLEGRLYGSRFDEICRELDGFEHALASSTSDAQVAGNSGDPHVHAEHTWTASKVDKVVITTWPLGTPESFVGRMREMDVQ